VILKGEASDGRAGLELYRNTKPDLVFLDVEMPELDGFEFLDRIQPTQAAIVFVTAWQKYAERAFDFCALDFLRKPVEPTRLVQAVHRATERHHLLHTQGQYQMLLELIQHQSAATADKRNHRIAFATQTEIVYSWMRNLVRVDADTNFSYVKLAEQQQPLHIARNIGDYERQFEEYPFMYRSHKSHLVNLYHVKKFLREDCVLLMTDGLKVPLSDAKRVETLRRLAELGVEI
jgi:two-component system LytT family response regulator